MCGDKSGHHATWRNQLADASSPYLREHADNPVAWYEWGPEPLKRAREENKPVIISIGYASCHWCHVMEEESFMDTAVARMMNENFISIKVDREQRPDVDQIYLDAAQLISGSAGWPLNAFAMPDGKPFYAGTYFPKDQWLMILHQIKDAFERDKEAVTKQAEALTQGIGGNDLIQNSTDSVQVMNRQRYEGLFDRWAAHLDFKNGGQTGAPKFPMPVIWESLLQYHFLTDNKQPLTIVTTTLDRMAAGAVYDQIGGGFCRYSTDEAWRIPHFEKMLYDNAQLVSLYSHAFQVTKDPHYLKVVRETLEFVKNELTDEEGGFYSSVNADSEGEEGKYYAWTKDEVFAILGEADGADISQYYNLTDSGNWQGGKNILYRQWSEEEFASKHNVPSEEWSTALERSRLKLLQARSKRIRPTTDEKSITAWNALMLKGYVDAYTATSDKEYLETALKSAHFLERRLMQKEGKGPLWRNYSLGKAGIDAFLDDYACLALAYIELYQITFDIHWLELARSLADYAIEHFRDSNTGMFYYPSDGTPDLVVRKMEITDQVIPSSNSVMAEVLMLLGEYFQHPSYTSAATDMLTRITGDRFDDPGIYYSNWARVSGILVSTPYEVAVMGRDALEKALALQQHYNPLAIYSGGRSENLPLLKNKLVQAKTIIYVCRERVCKRPVEDVAFALEELGSKP
jgi:uncharacterized protein